MPLPPHRYIDYTELSVKVTRSSTVAVKRALYTVPSRLIGATIRVHLYHDRLACFVGQTRVITLPRVYPATPAGRARRIDYRHIIHSLAAKPQAFRFSQLRGDLYLMFGLFGKVGDAGGVCLLIDGTGTTARLEDPAGEVFTAH